MNFEYGRDPEELVGVVFLEFAAEEPVVLLRGFRKDLDERQPAVAGRY